MEGDVTHALIVNARVRIALIDHDGQKQDMVEWAAWNRALLRGADLCGTLVVFFWDRLRRMRMRRTFVRCYGSPCCTTSRSRANADPQISSSPRGSGRSASR